MMSILPGYLSVDLQPSRLAMGVNSAAGLLLMAAIGLAVPSLVLAVSLCSLALLLTLLTIAGERKVALTLVYNRGQFYLPNAEGRQVPARMVSYWNLSPWLLHLSFKIELQSGDIINPKHGVDRRSKVNRRVTVRVWRDSCGRETLRLLRAIVCN